MQFKVHQEKGRGIKPALEKAKPNAKICILWLFPSSSQMEGKPEAVQWIHAIPMRLKLFGDALYTPIRTFIRQLVLELDGPKAKIVGRALLVQHRCQCGASPKQLYIGSTGLGHPWQQQDPITSIISNFSRVGRDGKRTVGDGQDSQYNSQAHS